jgi:predicted RNA-binding protein YlxR (DUF448 family)
MTRVPTDTPADVCRCREMKEQEGTVSVVRSPEGNIELDHTGKKAGRGLLCRR